MAQAEQAYARVVARPARPLARFDPAQIAHLPEIAQRYFRHAIAPGTPLYSVAELEMTGTFLLGAKTDLQSYRMEARQALRSSREFVWLPELRSGPFSIIGSDALVEGTAWSRFWVAGLVPVAQEMTSPDLVRSARFRAAVESGLWLPASLLPENGVEWQQVGPDEGEVTFTRTEPEIRIRLRLDSTGRVSEVVGQRWSNANSAEIFQYQPFGGTLAAEATFQGLTIPTVVAVGNHFGTGDYVPFFQARIKSAKYY